MSAPIQQSREGNRTVSFTARLSRPELACRLLLGGAATAYLMMYLAVAILRVRYPFELEWMEGGIVGHVRRILEGKLLYVPPTLDFVPYIYTPLYYYVCAPLAKLTGLGYVPLRAVSIASSLGCFAILYFLVKRETGSRFAGLLAMGFFAATYALSGAWWDIARIDTLFLFLLLLAIYFLCAEPRPWNLIFAGVVMWLSYLTKQQALFFGAAAAVVLVITVRKRALYYLGALVVPLVAGNLLLNWIHGGWYNFYTWELPQTHRIFEWAYLGFWFGDVLPILLIMMLLSIAFLLLEWRGNRARMGRYLALLLSALGASWLSRLHVGGYINVLMPMHVVLALMGALGVGTLLSVLEKKQVKWLIFLLYAACALQFVLLHYSPSRYLPTARDAEAGRTFIALLTSYPGEVYVPDHALYTTFAGKRDHAHSMAISDVLRGEGGEAQQALRQEIKQAYQSHRFSAVVLDRGRTGDTMKLYYRKDRDIFPNENVFIPVTGYRIRPEEIYVPK